LSKGIIATDDPEKPASFLYVLGVGLEPTCLSALAPKASASAISPPQLERLPIAYFTHK
jgi:hypothetical protein